MRMRKARLATTGMILLGLLVGLWGLLQESVAEDGEVETDYLSVLKGGDFYGSVAIEEGEAPTSDLSLHYGFVSSGSPVEDLSGNGNNGGVTDAVWTADGRFGGAYEFDGADDYIDGGDIFDLGGSITDLTVSAWVNLASVSSDQMVVGKLHTTSPYKGWGLMLINSGTPFVDLMADYTAGQRAYSQSSEAIGTNEWHFLVARCHADPGHLWSAISVDGVLMGTNCWSGARASMDTDAGCWVGCRSPGKVMDYKGVVDEVRIYERWLGDAEIAQLYYCGMTGSTFRVSVPTTIERLVPQGDIGMGTYTNE